MTRSDRIDLMQSAGNRSTSLLPALLHAQPWLILLDELERVLVVADHRIHAEVPNSWLGTR